ncbi:hypothetical protein ACFYN3_28370 [Streptomyces lavendulae]
MDQGPAGGDDRLVKAYGPDPDGVRTPAVRPRTGLGRPDRLR